MSADQSDEDVDLERQRKSSWWHDYAICERSWPWHVRVVSEQKLAALTDEKIPAARIRHLLEAAHEAAFEARVADDADFVQYMTPVGGWREHERDFCQRLFSDSRPPHFYWQDYVELHVIHGLKIPVIHGPAESTPEALHRIESWLARIDQPATWTVPYDEWTFIQDDFRPCLAFPIHNEVGYAFHRPQGARDSAYKSVCAWRAKLFVQLVRAAYTYDSRVVQAHWKYTEQPDPVYRFLSLPTAESHREAGLFLRAARSPYVCQTPSRSLRAPSISDVQNEVAFFSDRVEFCGTDICSGSRSRNRRVVLELLSQRRNNTFVAYSSQELASAAAQYGVDVDIPGLIRDLRKEIGSVLAKPASNVTVSEVILSGGSGYRFADEVTVRYAEPSMITDISDISDTDAEADVRDHVRNDVQDEPIEEGARRKVWILQQLAQDVQLKAPMVAHQFKRSTKTAQRDLDDLRREGKIEFEGDPRTGYYRLRDAPTD